MTSDFLHKRKLKIQDSEPSGQQGAWRRETELRRDWGRGGEGSSREKQIAQETHIRQM